MELADEVRSLQSLRTRQRIAYCVQQIQQVTPSAGPLLLACWNERFAWYGLFSSPEQQEQPSSAFMTIKVDSDYSLIIGSVGFTRQNLQREPIGRK